MMVSNTLTPINSTQEEKMLAVAACITAHIFLGLAPLGIYLLKRRESQYVAYYASIGTMAGAMMIIAILLFTVSAMLGIATAFGGIASTEGGSPLGPLFSLLGLLIGVIQWPLLILAAPVMLVIMLVSAISAWNGNLVELPVISPLARRFAGL